MNAYVTMIEKLIGVAFRGGTMATVEEHYGNVLSDVYIWMSGGFDVAIKKNTGFFEAHGISPVLSGVAVDLGAGCGFQSIPLARAGFSVTAIDIDGNLLKELGQHSKGLSIRTVQDDLVNFSKYMHSKAELVVCMTDTLLHLESRDRVDTLFINAMDSLEQGGKFVITFRDLSSELLDIDRFIPVKSDDSTIFTCFLEYEADSVKVHDLVHRKVDGEWRFNKSYYRKLRLSREWVDEQLSAVGFSSVTSSIEYGFVTVVAVK